MTSEDGPVSAVVEMGLLDGSNAREVNDVADLHLEFLSDSLVVKFGSTFLRQFYYGKLIRDGLIKATICRANGKVVGFFSYTSDPGFMGVALKRYPFRVLWMIAISVLKQPSLIKDVLLVVRLLLTSGADSGEALKGCDSEGLSVAIRPEWAKAVPPGGETRMPIRLFENLVADLRQGCSKTLCMFVQPDNLMSNLFFGSMLGCELTKVQRAGVDCHRYTYDLRADHAAPETGT